MVTPGPAGGHNRIFSLFRFRAPLNRRCRNLIGYCRRRLACPNNRQQTGRVATDGLRLAHLAVLSVDRSLFFPFAGTAHQYRQDPIHLRFPPFLSHPGHRYATNCGAIGRRDDNVGDRRDSL